MADLGVHEGHDEDVPAGGDTEHPRHHDGPAHHHVVIFIYTS